MNHKKKTLLWRLERTDFPGPSFVFGTMHVRDARAFAYFPAVQHCILSCEAFALEFHLEEIGQFHQPEALHLPDGQTLDQLMPPRRYERMRRVFLRAVGIDLQLLRDRLPLLISQLIEERLLARDMPQALDEMLWIFARQNDKALFGIETYQEQLHLLSHIPLQHQLNGLYQLSRNLPKHRRHLLRLTRLYEKAEIQQLYQSARRGTQSLRQLMLYNRNRLMADRIHQLASGQSLCCAIGAAHLAGAKGVLRLLKQKGWSVLPENAAEGNDLLTQPSDSPFVV